MSNIAQVTKNYHEYQTIMAVLRKRTNDTGKNWRHVYKKREYGYKDDDINNRGGDSYSRDGDRYDRDSDGGYKEEDYNRGRSRSNEDIQSDQRSRSSDRYMECGYDDDGRHSSRGN
ncbi:hypothetical protein C5167_025298 [Papaver somniferum]|uniref:ENTH domain-containing protein n=1 Tax=Papaver somniferum TaxID=3469 RepID=A0A4Y7JUQ9_PAPSO|nr:hypothetical protein C5167_025298 [Papaver somniferum]